MKKIKCALGLLLVVAIVVVSISVGFGSIESNAKHTANMKMIVHTADKSGAGTDRWIWLYCMMADGTTQVFEDYLRGSQEKNDTDVTIFTITPKAGYELGDISQWWLHMGYDGSSVGQGWDCDYFRLYYWQNGATVPAGTDTTGGTQIVAQEDDFTIGSPPNNKVLTETAWQFDNHNYTLTYAPANGAANTSFNVVQGATIDKTYCSYYTTNPSRTGYTFSGWSPALPTYGPSANTTYTAQWTPLSYTITWANGGGTGGGTNSCNYNATPTAMSVARTGYTFAGWSPAIATCTGAATYTATWNLNYWNLTYNANGGTGGSGPTSTGYGTALSAPSVSRTGYNFTGWSPSVPATMPNAASTYTAGWSQNSYTYTYDANGGTGGTSGSLHYGDAIPAAPTVTRTGWTFTGWSPTLATTMPDNNVTYAAQWSQNNYTYKYDANGGTGGTSGSLHYGDAIPAAPTVTRTGWTFNGWSPTPASTMPNNSVTYYAQWSQNSYSYTYDANGGTGGTSGALHYGDAIPAAPTVTWAGHTFTGWSPTPAATMPAGNVTYTAGWTLTQYTISFNSNGGSAVGSITQNYGTTAAAPTAPTKTGNTFAGWYSDAGLTNAVSWPYTIAGNVTFYAKWTVNNYTINFNSDGGSAVSSITQAYGSSVTPPANPTKIGYAFSGWLPDCPTTMPYSTTSCVAQWVPNQYTVSFNSNGGSTVTAKTQNFGTSVTEPTPPTKASHAFAGWFKEAGLTTEVEWPYDLGAANVTFYAKWTMNQSAIDNITVALTENEDDMTVTVYNAVEGCKYQIWSYQSVTSDLLLDGESSVQANQWILLKAYDTSGQAVGTLAYTIGKFTSPNNNYTIAVRIIDGSGAYVREIRDSYTKTEVGTAEITKVLVDGEYVRGSSQEDRDSNIKSTVIKDVEQASPVIKVMGNLPNMTYTATVVETGLPLTATIGYDNEFVWDISAYTLQRYTVRVTAGTDTLDLNFMLYTSGTAITYASMSSLALTGGSLLTAPQIIGINPTFSNGNFFYVVREMGRAANYKSGTYATSGNINHEIAEYGIYHVYGYANRATMNPSESNYDDGFIKPIDVKRSLSPSSMTISATVNAVSVNLADPIEKGKSILIKGDASIAGVGGAEEPGMQYSFWRYDAKGYVLIKDWSSDDTLAWTPARVGNYNIEVRAKGEDAGSYEIKKSVAVSIVYSGEEIAQGVTITVNEDELADATARTPITVKATVDNPNNEALLFRFFVHDDAMLTRQLQAYSANQECIWTPRKNGTYTITVQAKNDVSFGKYDVIKQVTIVVD